MRKTEVYKLIKKGDYEEAAFLLLEEQSSSYNAPHLSSPSDVFPILKKYAARKKEHFLVVTLDGAHHVIREVAVSIGLVNRTVVHPREVFRPAIMDSAVAIIIAHNHPSGRLDPSSEDIEITKRIANAGKTIGIPVLDHLIFRHDSYFSFTEHGMMDVGDVE